MTAKTRTTGLFAAIALLAGLSACVRNPAPMTKCIGDKPAVARVMDVGPPNCPKG